MLSIFFIRINIREFESDWSILEHYRLPKSSKYMDSSMLGMKKNDLDELIFTQFVN